VVFKALLAHPEGLTDLHPGVQWIGIAPTLIGLSHLIVYLVGRRTEARGSTSTKFDLSVRELNGLLEAKHQCLGSKQGKGQSRIARSVCFARGNQRDNRRVSRRLDRAAKYRVANSVREFD
jgi:hypothetical protein